MKTHLDKQQSQHLIDLGVSKEYANWRVIGLDVDTSLPLALLIETSKVEPYFTLEALLEILPKEIGHHSCISINWNFITEKWDVDYDCTLSSWHGAKELIDSLYELCVWCLEQGYLKFK